MKNPNSVNYKGGTRDLPMRFQLNPLICSLIITGNWNDKVFSNIKKDRKCEWYRPNDLWSRIWHSSFRTCHHTFTNNCNRGYKSSINTRFVSSVINSCAGPVVFDSLVPHSIYIVPIIPIHRATVPSFGKSTWISCLYTFPDLWGDWVQIFHDKTATYLMISAWLEVSHIMTAAIFAKRWCLQSRLERL